MLPVRGDGPPQSGTGTAWPPPSSTGPLAASAAAGRDVCVEHDGVTAPEHCMCWTVSFLYIQILFKIISIDFSFIGTRILQ